MKTASIPSRSRFNPYLVGAGIGVLSWLAFLLVDKPLGMSTEVSKFSGWIYSAFAGWDATVANPYWAKTTPALGYSTVFLLATGIGALVSSLVSREFKWERVPAVWQQRFGNSTPMRMLGAFGGGFLLLYGARMAGGCTSGHGISGTLQLAVSSWLFFAVMFASGVTTAKLMYRSAT